METQLQTHHHNEQDVQLIVCSDTECRVLRGMILCDADVSGVKGNDSV